MCGEHRPKSDIDLAVFGGDQVRFALHAEEAPALLAFDFVNWDGWFSKNILAIYEVVGPRRSVSLGV